MRVHRTRHDRHFTPLPNALLRDPRLSYRARGVLAELLSRPDGRWATADSLSRIARHERGGRGEGRDAMRAVFAELKAVGYLVAVRVRRDDGTVTTELHVHDVPRFPGEVPEHPVVDRGTGNQASADRSPVHQASTRSTDDEETPSVRKRESTGRAPARGAAPERSAPLPRSREGAAVEGSAAAPPGGGPSMWALGVIALVPDAALYAPDRDRAALAGRLDALTRAGVPRADLERAVRGWEDTVRPFAALTVRLASPESVRAWNARAAARSGPGHGFGGVPLGRAAGHGEEAPAQRPRFVLDSQGTAARTCPVHPTVRNVPGGVCRVCGRPCRTEPGGPVEAGSTSRAAPGAGPLPGLPVGVDDLFAVPKCDDPRCCSDRSSPRYRTVTRLDASGSKILAVPCPTCGHRLAGAPTSPPTPVPVAA